MTPEPEAGRVSTKETASLPEPRLKPGDIVAGRFVVVRFVARGGMGEVYEVGDRHLQDKRHALKTLRPELALNEALRARFEREVLLAREVHHPNVCPTYDLFHVTDDKGPLSFLTMKLLRGESLHARIRRDGRLSPAMVKLVAHQLAGALDAAHASGVVHRDLKPGNVMLEEDASGVHVSVTDFGLSRVHDAEDTLGAPGQVLGTPGYVAPEILRGQTAGFGVDVYAFGVIVYEMLTGRRPDDPLFPTPVSSMVPGVDEYWDRLVEGCLAAQPQFRFKSCGDALALATRDLPPAVAMTSGPARSARKRLAAAALAIAIGGASWLAVFNWEAFFRPLPEKRYVALMAWPVDADAAHQPLLRTLIDSVSSRLARAESSTAQLMVINGSDVGGAQSIKAPGDAASVLGANLVLATSLVDRPGGLRLGMSVLDSATGQTVRQRVEDLDEGRLSQLSQKAAAMAAALLDLTLPGESLTDHDEIAGLMPAAFQALAVADELAARPNDSGLDEAIAKYQALLETEPKFAVGHARLSSLYERRYRRVTDRAVLSLAERNADLALRLNPDSVSAILSKAGTDLHVGRIDDALAAMQRALDLDPGNTQILAVKARAFRALDRLRDEEAMYRELVSRRPNYWPAYDQLGLALYRQARYAEAAQAFTEGTIVAPNIVRLLNNLGAMQMLLQRRDAAAETYRRSIAAAPTPPALQNLGTLAFMKQDYKGALSYYTQALALTPKDEGIFRNIGDVYAVLGDRARSLEFFAKGEQLVRQAIETNPRRGETWMISAYYHAKLGRKAAAESAMREADRLGASSMPSQLKKTQTLVLLGRPEEALVLLLELRTKGLSSEDVDVAIDLRDLRRDPRYLATLKSNPS